jgi:hypothetical protein
MFSAVGPARGEQQMKSRAAVLRWSALRDKKADLKEVTESFLVHRHDPSQATQTNYRLQFRLYDGGSRHSSAAPRASTTSNRAR